MKIPVFLPVTREFGFRDEFAQDCLLQGRVMQTTGSSAASGGARHHVSPDRRNLFASARALDPSRVDPATERAYKS